MVLIFMLNIIIMINIVFKNQIFSRLPTIVRLNTYKFHQLAKFYPTKLSMKRSQLMMHKNRFNFCNNKDNKKENKQEEKKPLQGQKNQRIKSQDQQLAQLQEQMLNKIAGLNKGHSFKNELIVAQQSYKKNIKQLKQTILFEDLLKKQIDILIYDTQGKPYLNHTLKTLISMIFFVVITYLALKSLNDEKIYKLLIEKTPEGRTIITFVKIITGFILLRLLFRHLKMNKRYVQKITYHTQDQNFTFVRRKFYGAKYDEKVSRFKLLYTENPGLNKRGTNYINIQNQKQYSIGYQFAWKKQDLFSHLISQRIRK